MSMAVFKLCKSPDTGGAQGKTSEFWGNDQMELKLHSIRVHLTTLHDNLYFFQGADTMCISMVPQWSVLTVGHYTLHLCLT